MTALVGEVVAVPSAGTLEAAGRGDIATLVDLWIRSVASSPHTVTAYRRDLAAWLQYCQSAAVDPLKPRKTDVEEWHRRLRETPSKRTRRPLAKSSVARMVSAVASFYSFLVDEDAVDAVPVRSRTRPRAPKESTTGGLSAQEAAAFRRAARDESPRDRATAEVLVVEGVRVSELTALPIRAYRYNKGRRTLRVAGKGDKTREIVCAKSVAGALDALLADRAAKLGVRVPDLPADDLMFVSVAGGPLTQQSVLRTVQRIAHKAGIAAWSQITPHWLRHTCATLMLDAGVPIDRVQYQLGHEDITTTQRYDRSRGSLDRSGVGDFETFLDGVESAMRDAA